MIQNERASAPAQQLRNTVNNTSGYTSGISKTKPNWITKRLENAKPIWNTEKMRNPPQHRAKMGPGIARRRATREVEIQKRQSERKWLRRVIRASLGHPSGTPPAKKTLKPTPLCPSNRQIPNRQIQTDSNTDSHQQNPTRPNFVILVSFFFFVSCGAGIGQNCAGEARQLGWCFAPSVICPSIGQETGYGKQFLGSMGLWQKIRNIPHTLRPTGLVG